MSQRLPRFMRRRASSHNPKRIPRSVRQLIGKSSDQNKQSDNKKNNTYKRKHVNKKKQQISVKRRSQREDRSVLHIWFAKRFQMVMHCNRLIPMKNNTKNQRILYHKSKDDVVFYYHSLENCIEIDYSNCSEQEVINYLSKFINEEIGSRLEMDKDREVNAIFYDPNNPTKPLSPVKLIWSQTGSKLLILNNVCESENIESTLIQISDQCLSSKLSIVNKKNNLDRLRVIGPKTLHLLSRCLNFDFNVKLSYNETKSDSIHYFRYNDNTVSAIDSSQTSLFNGEPKDDTFSKSLSKDFDFALIIKNKALNNRFVIDIIVSSDSVKTLWYRITENRSHRVGGLRDMETMALNTSSLFFPQFGFIDHKDNQLKLQILKQHLNCVDQDMIVLRNVSLICKLSRNMSSNNLNQISESVGSRCVLINVEVLCVGRGVPQEFDLICLPSKEEVQRVFEVRRDSNVDSFVELNDKSDERKTIGLIEFGKYCLERSRGKGLGVISIAGLKEVIAVNESIQSDNYYKNNRIVATFRSLKSGLCRTVFVKLIDSVLSV